MLDNAARLLDARGQRFLHESTSHHRFGLAMPRAQRDAPASAPAMAAGLDAIGNDQHSVMGSICPGPGVTIGPGLVFALLAVQDAVGRLRH